MQRKDYGLYIRHLLHLNSKNTIADKKVLCDGRQSNVFQETEIERPVQEVNIRLSHG